MRQKKIWRVFRPQNRYSLLRNTRRAKSSEIRLNRFGGGDGVRRPFRVVSNLVIHGGGRRRLLHERVLGGMNGQQGKSAAGKRQGKRQKGSGHAREGFTGAALA